MISLSRSAVAMLIASSALTGDLRAEGYDPFRIPRDRFAADVRTVVMQPVQHARPIPNAPELRSHIREKLSERLKAAGFRVVPMQEWEQRWRRHSERLGGVFDPVTGAADDEKYDAVRDFTRADLVADFGVDAVVRPSIYWRDVRWGWTPPWHHVTSLGEPVTWKGEPFVFGELPRNAPQRVVAPHVGITIESHAGVTLFDIGCGIRWQTVYIARSFEDRPHEEVFAPEWLDASIDVCTADLLSLRRAQASQR